MMTGRGECLSCCWRWTVKATETDSANTHLQFLSICDKEPRCPGFSDLLSQSFLAASAVLHRFQVDVSWWPNTVLNTLSDAVGLIGKWRQECFFFNIRRFADGFSIAFTDVNSSGLYLDVCMSCPLSFCSIQKLKIKQALSEISIKT